MVGVFDRVVGGVVGAVVVILGSSPGYVHGALRAAWRIVRFATDRVETVGFGWSTFRRL
jgi:hypothetical protein